MDPSVRWFKTRHQDRLNGVALVIHGLNLHPDKMKSIINPLTEAGVEAVNLSLRGHGANFAYHPNVSTVRARIEAFKAASLPLWFEETRRAYWQVKERSKEKKAPIFLIGFSFGGLIGLDLFTKDPAIWFDKMILFAPAISIRAIYHVIKWLKPFPRFVIPSLSLKSYRANKGTPVSGFNALFEALIQFRTNLSPKLNIPTIIFINKGDEFISYRGIQKIIEDEKLDKWKLHWVQKTKKNAQLKPFHLIIDESSVGKNSWYSMMRTMIDHILN